MTVGAKVSTIWYVDVPDPAAVLRGHPEPDLDAAQALASRLHPDLVATPTGPVPLAEAVAIDAAGTVHIGSYPGVTVVCGPDLAVPRPSSLPETRFRPTEFAKTYYVASKPDLAWGAFALWEDGHLARSFSATPVHIHEDLGIPLVWERPYWAGDFPLQYPAGILPDPQSLPFHPQQFAEGANREWLGFRYTGAPESGEVDPKTLTVLGFAVHPPGESREVEEPPEPEQPAPEPGLTPAPPPAAARKGGLLRRYFGF
ncbi:MULTISPECIES: DUF6928 family protein [unclassified Rhodococcus (in: high G+C Gram-positive bacteria)]|uniref:DUF6928 family protein n=1 Tax=unclassified Rhodococcus (in: high G+C Gram-positive bacteria) TaxID=192944 RepID=UPI00163B5DFD|nr:MULTISPECIES: hypothetical protein [unclassified Rhodococcus (in: high G+C Gram-positive bacteria)]MBC2639730.1 hypothetical protein [Rhodococcus sp. 3A]MBC2895525.1 hypothetical protein [Rhodococcus sp. 4CII]